MYTPSTFYMKSAVSDIAASGVSGSRRRLLILRPVHYFPTVFHCTWTLVTVRYYEIGVTWHIYLQPKAFFTICFWYMPFHNSLTEIQCTHARDFSKELWNWRYIFLIFRFHCRSNQKGTPSWSTQILKINNIFSIIHSIIIGGKGKI